MKFAYPDWLHGTCKNSLLGGHGKARRAVTGTALNGHPLLSGQLSKS